MIFLALAQLPPEELSATQKFVVEWAESKPRFKAWLGQRFSGGTGEPAPLAQEHRQQAVAVSASGEQHEPPPSAAQPCVLACCLGCEAELDAGSLSEAACVSRCVSQCQQQRTEAVDALLAMLRCPAAEAPCPPLLLPALRALRAVDAHAEAVLETLAARPEAPQIPAHNLSRARLAEQLQSAPGGTLLVQAACTVPPWATWERAASDFGGHFPYLSGAFHNAPTFGATAERLASSCGWQRTARRGQQWRRQPRYLEPRPYLGDNLTLTECAPPRL